MGCAVCGSSDIGEEAENISGRVAQSRERSRVCEEEEAEAIAVTTEGEPKDEEAENDVEGGDAEEEEEEEEEAAAAAAPPTDSLPPPVGTSVMSGCHRRGEVATCDRVRSPRSKSNTCTSVAYT